MNKLSGLPLIIKFTLAFAILGMVNAVVGMGVTIYLNTQVPVNLSVHYAWENLVLLIWPASLGLASATRTTPGTVFTAVVSVIANGYIYGMLGIVIGAIRHRYKVDTYGTPPTGLKAPARKIARRALIWGGVVSVITNVVVAWCTPGFNQPGAVLYSTVAMWVLLWVMIFLPLFLQAGLRARRK